MVHDWVDSLQGMSCGYKMWHMERQAVADGQLASQSFLFLCKAFSGILLDGHVGVQTLSAKRFESGRILVDNEAEPDLTVVTINERKESTAALLDVASAMTGIGVLIHEAIIQVLLPCASMHTRNQVQTHLC